MNLYIYIQLNWETIQWHLSMCCFSSPCYLLFFSPCFWTKGGIMSTEEAESFEKDPDFNLYCQIRRYDERAKVTVIPLCCSTFGNFLCILTLDGYDVSALKTQLTIGTYLTHQPIHWLFFFFFLRMCGSCFTYTVSFID